MNNKFMGYLGSKAKKLVRGGVHASVVGLSLFSFSNSAQAETDQQYVKIFFNKGYGYCDARKLAKVWGGSVWQAKVLGGKKIAWKNVSYLQSQWRKGVKIFKKYGYSCGQSNLTNDQQKFTYNDSSRVVDAWTKDSKS